MNHYHYILDGHEPKRVDLMEWARWLETAERHVALDKINRMGLSMVSVSTVFLGLDHQWGDGPPLLFETMIFGGKHDGYCERYATWDEAEAGHKVALALAKET